MPIPLHTHTLPQLHKHTYITEVTLRLWKEFPGRQKQESCLSRTTIAIIIINLVRKLCMQIKLTEVEIVSEWIHWTYMYMYTWYGRKWIADKDCREAHSYSVCVCVKAKNKIKPDSNQFQKLNWANLHPILNSIQTLSWFTQLSVNRKPQRWKSSYQ